MSRPRRHCEPSALLAVDWVVLWPWRVRISLAVRSVDGPTDGGRSVRLAGRGPLGGLAAGGRVDERLCRACAPSLGRGLEPRSPSSSVADAGCARSTRLVYSSHDCVLVLE